MVVCVRVDVCWYTVISLLQRKLTPYYVYNIMYAIWFHFHYDDNSFHFTQMLVVLAHQSLVVVQLAAHSLVVVPLRNHRQLKASL